MAYGKKGNHGKCIPASGMGGSKGKKANAIYSWDGKKQGPSSKNKGFGPK